MKRFVGRNLAVILLSVITLFSAATQAAPQRSADGPILIGLSLGLSGKYAALADMQQKAFRLWESQLNQQGGLLGRSVQLVIRDDLSQKVEAERIYRQFLEQDEVDLLFSPYSSGITAAIMPVVEQHGVPLLISGASSDSLWEQGYRNIFGLYISASRYAVGFLEMVAMNGISEVGIVGADDLFSRTIVRGTREWAEQFGLQVALTHEFPKGKKDLREIAGEVAQQKIPALVVAGHFNESVDMQKALLAVGYQPQAYFATVGPALNKYQKELGEDAEGAFSSLQWSSQALHNVEDRRLFLQPFMDRYGEEPSYHAALAYAAGQILAKAVQKSGSLDRDRLREKLSRLNTMSVIGRYGVDRNGRQTRHFALNSQWQDGVREVVWPTPLATAAPRFQHSP